MLTTGKLILWGQYYWKNQTRMLLDSAKLRGRVWGNACPRSAAVELPQTLFLMLQGRKALFLPSSYWGFQAAIDAKADLSSICNWKQTKKPTGRDCPLLNVKRKWGLGRKHIGVCLSLKFLMPLLTKFRALSSPSQETTNAKKNTRWSGRVGGEEPPNYWTVISAAPLFWDIKQFSCVGVSHSVLLAIWNFFFIIIDLVTKSSLVPKALAHPSRSIMVSRAFYFIFLK